MVGTFAFQVLTEAVRPFRADLALLRGLHARIYVVQAISYHDWAVEGPRRGAGLLDGQLPGVLGPGVVPAGLSLGPGKAAGSAKVLPKAADAWSVAPVNLLCPLSDARSGASCCAGSILRGSTPRTGPTSAEAALFMSFPLFLLVAGVLLIVTGRQPDKPRPAYTAAGVAIAASYMLIWMFNGKRSHSLIAVLAGVCSFYIPRFRRPSFPVLIMTAVMGLMAVGIAIGWRYHSSRRGRTARSRGSSTSSPASTPTSSSTASI